MHLDRGLFPKLLVSTIAVAILGFFVRGFSQLVVGVETARVLSLPLFLLGLGLAVICFVFSVLFKVGLITDESSTADFEE